jgi:hypothetical protein
LTNCLIGRIAKQPLRTAIPARDDACEVFGQYGVVGILDDGSEMS